MPMRIKLFLLSGLLLAGLPAVWPTASLMAGKDGKGTKPPVGKIHGRIQFVDSFPDFKVQQVSAFPDLRVQKVTAFPAGPGQWQIVDSFPDFKIQMVEAFPDFTVQFVDSFPGVGK